MSPHFCKVGRIKPNLNKVLGLEELERMYKNFIEDAYNLIQTDAVMSDLLYHEASKLKKNILYVKRSEANDLDAVI